MSVLKMRDLTSKAEVLETYAELFDMFDDSKEICKELCKVYDKIRGLPPIDAVPVVRCKDCKWWREETDHTCRKWGGASPRKANGYCDEGEGRTDGTD